MMPWHLFPLRQQLHPQLNLRTLSDLLAPLPCGMVGPTLQSPQLPVVPPLSRPLPRHPLRLLLYHRPPRSLLFQSSIRGVSQSSSKVPPKLYQILPLKQLPPPHVPPHYLHNPTRVSHIRRPSQQVLYARAKMVILPLLGPPFTRVP